MDITKYSNGQHSHQSIPPARATIWFVSSTANVAAVVRPALASSPFLVQHQLQPIHGECARVDVYCCIQFELVAAVGNAVP